MRITDFIILIANSFKHFQDTSNTNYQPGFLSVIFITPVGFNTPYIRVNSCI